MVWVSECAWTSHGVYCHSLIIMFASGGFRPGLANPNKTDN